MLMYEVVQLFAMLMVVSSYLIAFSVPFMKQECSIFIDYKGDPYVNYLLSYAIYGIITGMSVFLGIGSLILVLSIVGILIVSAIKALGSEKYRTSLTLQMVFE